MGGSGEILDGSTEITDGSAEIMGSGYVTEASGNYTVTEVTVITDSPESGSGNTSDVSGSGSGQAYTDETIDIDIYTLSPFTDDSISFTDGSIGFTNEPIGFTDEAVPAAFTDESVPAVFTDEPIWPDSGSGTTEPSGDASGFTDEMVVVTSASEYTDEMIIVTSASEYTDEMVVVTQFAYTDEMVTESDFVTEPWSETTMAPMVCALPYVNEFCGEIEMSDGIGNCGIDVITYLQRNETNFPVSIPVIIPVNFW